MADMTVSDSSRPAEFATTRWSIVLAAGHASVHQARSALAELCRAYWYPLYAYVRRRGHQQAEAQDLTQAFFAQLLEKDSLQAADRERGRFRAFLLTMFQRFLLNEHKHATAQKRGGGRLQFSLDFDSGEERLAREPVDAWTPEKIYSRRWALTLLDHVLDELDREYARKGKSDWFIQLRPFIIASAETPSHAQVAETLGQSEGALKVAIHRLRQRYRDLLRAAIAQTVSRDEDVDDELRELLAALRRD